MSVLSKGSRQALVAVCLLLLCAIPARGQKASNWRTFRMADGLPETACASVSMGSHGRILLRHPNQPYISHLDGYMVQRIPAPEGGSKHVHESPAGQLWTATHKGLLEFKDGAWALHPVDVIASRHAASPKRPLDLPICVVRQGMVIFLLPDLVGAYHARDASRPRSEVLATAEQMKIGRFSGLMLARDGSLWVAGEHGLSHSLAPARSLRSDTVWQTYHAPEQYGITRLSDLVEYEDGSLSMLGEVNEGARKAVLQLEAGSWSQHAVPIENVISAWVSPGRRLYAVTPSAFYEGNAATGEFIESEEVSARQYFDVAVEPGGGFWLATSDGMYRYAPPTWRIPASIRRLAVPVHSILSDRQDRLWFIAGNALHQLHGERHREYPLPAPSLRSLYSLRSGLMVLDGGGRLFTFNTETGLFTDAGDGERNWRVYGEMLEGALCVGHEEGEGAVALLNFDGSSFTPAELPDEVHRLGAVMRVFLAQTGDLWVGAERGTALLRDEKWRTFTATQMPSPEEATLFLEQPDGRIWCAARDRLWESDGREWVELPRSFDRVNALIRARDGSVWVAANSGCHRYVQGTWVEHGPEEGLPGGAVRDLREDLRGRVWAASSSGLALYHPEADTDPPKAYIQDLRETERNLPEGSSINLAFSGLDKWKYCARDRLLYSFRLDQRDWSEFFDQTYVSFQDLPAGKHYFQVRAMDRNCNIDPRPARLEFTIVVPWYRESRLVGIAFVGMTVAIFFAALAFNRHRRLVRSYAEVEKKVAERTRQLEIANRELLQSQKMTALGTLAAGIAHDFNNILSIIKGSAQIIEQNLDNTPKVQTRVDRIKTVVEQGAGIVKAMLGFSRESGQQGPCDLNSVVEDTIKLLGDRFLHEVRVSTQLAPGLPSVVTSRDLVQQILLNFVFNAAEAMTDRKEIIVSTRLFTQPPAELVLAPGASDTFVGVSVTDYGCGIPPENLPRIFEPFFTTKAFSARRGTGLGLSMVYELAKRLNAGLCVDSVVGRGSTFVLLLPVKTSPNNVYETSEAPGHRG